MTNKTEYLPFPITWTRLYQEYDLGESQRYTSARHYQWMVKEGVPTSMGLQVKFLSRYL